MNSFINILIPFYNAEESLAETIKSVEDQTSGNWKIIFINDGSTDGSVKIVDNFLQLNPGKGVLLQSHKARSGPAVCRNLGIDNADGKYLLCLDSDDQLEPFCVEQRLKVMSDNPSIDWAVFNQYQSSPTTKPPFPIFNKKVKTKEDCIRFFIGMDVAWQTMGPIWKVKSLVELGGFDSTLYPSEDPDLHLRALLKSSLKFKICSEYPADCYYNVENKTGEKLQLFYKESIISKIKFIRKMLDYLPTIAEGNTLINYKRYLRKGFYLFLKSFLLVRLKEYENEAWGIIKDLKKVAVLSSTDVIKLRIIHFVFTTDSNVVKLFRLKGIAANILIPTVQ